MGMSDILGIQLLYAGRRERRAKQQPGEVLAEKIKGPGIASSWVCTGDPARPQVTLQ